MRNGNGRVMAPLHGGMGFGSEALRERGVSTARRSALESEERRKAAAGVPLSPMPGATGHGGVAAGPRERGTRVAPEAKLPSPCEDAFEDAAFVDRKPGATARPLRTYPVGSAALAQVPARDGAKGQGRTNAWGEPSFASRSAPTPRDAAREGLAVGRIRALCGMLLDVVVLGCVTILSALLTYARGGGLLGERLLAALDAATAGAIAPHLQGARFQWAGYAVEAGLTAAALLFLCQFLSVSFFHSTLGRFVVGVELAPDQRGPAQRVATAAAEVVSAGGIFALPFVLLTPKRMPIFLWLRLVRGA